MFELSSKFFNPEKFQMTDLKLVQGEQVRLLRLLVKLHKRVKAAEEAEKLRPSSSDTNKFIPPIPRI